MADQELSDEQAASLGLDDAPTTQESGPGPDFGLGPASSIPTSIDVREPLSGGAAPLQAEPKELSDEEAKSLGLDDSPPPPNTRALAFVAQHGDLPPPDRAGQIIKYSVASGQPPELVAANFDNIKKQVDAGKLDWDELAKKNPHLAEFMAQDPHNIPLAVEDHKNLSMLEWATHAPWAALVDAIHEQGTVGLQFLRAEGMKTLGGKPLEEIIQRQKEAEQADAAAYGENYGAENILSKAVIATAKFAPYMVLDKASRVLGAGAGAFIGGLGGAETGPGAVGTSVAGAGAGQFGGSFLFNYAEALGPLSWELDHYTDKNGQHIDPAVANIAAQTGAATSGAIMAGSLGLFKGKAAPIINGWVQKAIPSLEKYSQAIAESSAAKFLADHEFLDGVTKFMGRWGLHTAIGAGMMAANSAATAGATEAAKAASGLDAHISNVVDASYRSGKQALQDLWLISAYESGKQSQTGQALIDYAKDLGRARLSEQGQARLQQSLQAAAASSMLEKSPEAFHAFVDLTAPDSKVYVPADRWVSYFQGKNLDAEKMAESVGVKPEELTKAVGAGGNIEIKSSDFLTQFAKTEHAAGLAQDIKSSPELETARESQELRQRQAEEAVKTEKERGADLKAGKQFIEDHLVAQAKAAGIKTSDARSSAKLLAEAAGATAAKLNVSIQEGARLNRMGDLVVTGKEGITQKHQELMKAFDEWLLPSATTQLRAKFESMSPENQARAVFLDKNTGLPNKAHFDDLNAHDAAQSFGPDAKDLQFANVGIAGTKFVNDSLDHGRGDLLYRAAGKALHDAAPDLNVSKPGGDFELRVRDQAHLDEILKKANANLPEQLKPFVLTGAVGESADKALEAHIELKQKAETAGTRAPRTDENKVALPPVGFKGEAKDISFPTEKVSREPNPEVAKQFSELSKEEKFNKAFVEPKTGLLNSLGWQMLDHGKDYHYAALDVRDLSLTNKKFGKVGGDTAIETLGAIISHYGGSSFDAAHLHGDEYALRHKDPYALSQMVDKIREHLADTLDATLPDGELIRVGIDLWHGIARGSYEAADRNLSERKAGAKGAAAAHVAPRAPGGNEAQLNPDSRQGSLERVGGLLEGRGASPQGFDGTDRARFLNQEALAAPKPPQAVLDAQAYIGRMRSADKKSVSQAFLDYATGKTDKRPVDVPAEVEKHMAGEWGLVDPAGYPYAAEGTSTRGDYGGPSKSGGVEKMPEELKRHYLENLAHRQGKYEQAPIANIEGRPVVFNEEDDKGGNEPRGRISFQPDENGRPRSFNLQLLNADKSTMLHESAHFLSWSLHDLAHSDLATPQIKADYDTLLKFAGYDSAGARLKAIAERGGQKEEERISHGFEIYVLEGKAPSSALARVFGRLKDWLGRIYSGITGIQQQYSSRYGQEIQLSDDVRQVFDRMLAQDNALKDAQGAVGGTGEVREAVAGMTPEQAAKYRETVADAKATADQQVAQSDRQAKLAAQREAFKAQTQAELDDKPVYAAWRYLQHGDAPGQATPPTDNNGKPFKLDRAEVEKEYGADAVKSMPPNSFVKTGGVSPDALAPLLGFNSGDDMVNALKAAQPRDEAISQGTQAKMDAANGPELERLTNAALSGVHNDKDLEAAVMELRGLAKQINPAMERRARAVDTEALRRNIDRMTAEKTISDLDPSNYARTERRLAMEAAELWGKGEKEAAYDKREQRLVNKLLFMSERDAKEELSAARDRIRDPSPGVRANLGKADPAYRDVHDSLLQAVGLAPRVVGADVPQGLDAMLAVADRDGAEVGDWTDTVRAILQAPTPWKNLNVEHARDVVDAIGNLRHIAREENEVTIAGKTQDRKELQQALYNRTASVRPAVEKVAHGGEKPTVMQRVASKYRGASGSLQELETFADMLDGGSTGPWNDLLVRSFLGSRDREVELIKSTLAPIKEAFEKIPKDMLKLRDQSMDLAGLLPPPKDTPAGYTRSWAWNLFMNMGNTGNEQRLVDGNKYTRENMLAAVSKLSEPELDFLQKVRDVANKQLFPELAKAYEKRMGLPLGKVEATPITINGKTYEGGYWPIRYDSDYEGNQGQRQEINDMKDLLPRVGTPTVTNSATKARQAKVMAPLDLTWGTVPQHFATVIHDIAYGDTIRQVGKMLIKPRIPDENIPSANKTASDFIGKERTAELLPALRDIAADRIDSTAGHVTALVKGTAFFRSRLTAAVIIGNLPSLARHLTDPLVAAVDTEGVPLHHIAAAYLKVMNPGSWGEFEPFSRSKEIEYHRVKHEENLRQELGRMGNAEGRLEKAARVGFKLQSWMDAFISRIVFRGAYDHAIASGMDDAGAVQRGDDVLRRIVPSGDIATKPPILRTKQGWASCILFYGYASKIHQVESRLYDKLYRAWNADKTLDLDPTAPDQGTRASAVAEVAAKMIGLGLISDLGGYLSGRGPTKEEDEKKGTLASRMEWLATETMLSPMDNAPPIIGPAVKATLLGHKTNIGSAPELMLLDRELGKLGDLVHGKKKDDESATWDMVANMVGLLGPLGQAQKTIPFLGKAAEGREHVRGPLDLGAGAIYGEKKHQGANPLTDLQTVISGHR